MKQFTLTITLGGDAVDTLTIRDVASLVVTQMSGDLDDSPNPLRILAIEIPTTTNAGDPR